MLTTGQVCELLKVSRAWVSQEASSGRLPSLKIGSRYRFRAVDIEAYIEARNGAPPDPGIPENRTRPVGRPRQGW